MGSNNNRIFIYFNNDQLKQLVEKFGTDIKEELVKKCKEYLLAKIETGITQTEIKSLKEQIQEQQLLKLKIDNKIRLVHDLHIAPSEVAEIVAGKKDFDVQDTISQPTEAKTPSQKIAEQNAERLLESCKKNDLDQWVIICKSCRSDFIDLDLKKAKSEFVAHLHKKHFQELLT